MILTIPRPLVPKRARGPLLLMLAGIGMWLFGALFSVQSRLLELGLWLLGATVVFVAWVVSMMDRWWIGTGATLLAGAGVWLSLQLDLPLRTESWRMYLHQHQADLRQIVQRTGPVTEWWSAPAEGCCKVHGLRAADCAPLAAAMRHAGVSRVIRMDSATMLQTYGWIDARGGIAYCPGPAACKYAIRRIEGNWFTWAM